MYFLAGFCLGFIVSLFFKEEKTKNSIYFVCKVTNQEHFNETFPMIGSNYLQPYWQYFPKKKVIKIKIDDYYFKHNMTFEEFIETTSIDHDFFREFGETYVYFEYYINNNVYVNVFKYNENISDFKLNPYFYNDFVVDGVSYSSQFNKYVNNNSITPELVLLNCDNYDNDLDNCSVYFNDKKMELKSNLK